MTLRYAHVAVRDVEDAAKRTGSAMEGICGSVDFRDRSTYAE